eukprot:CAMPEP_0183703564 /NCGR_PEP_ID=MMETSP0737-20130205/1268_1 /TAXON_ID=385413 /ORGANISM="Thalassiosira miniscula, Strain CCMP1093" /LENGTH=760 /DNA_ID=CAMNT_0025930343 /DNA_START=191 /DNA_END=2473 /DNA_ORIENTATION=-
MTAPQNVKLKDENAADADADAAHSNMTAKNNNDGGVGSLRPRPRRPYLQRQNGGRNLTTTTDVVEHHRPFDTTTRKYATDTSSQRNRLSGNGNDIDATIEDLFKTKPLARRKAVTTESDESGGDFNHKVAFVRNKFKYDQSVQRIQDMQRLLRTPSGGGVAQSTLVKQTEEIFDLLSELRETNLQNETTIRHLQEKLVGLTNERDAALTTSNELTKLAAMNRSEWEEEMAQERKGFADVSHKQQKAIEKWKHKARKLWKRCKQMECELKEKEAVIKLREVQYARERKRENRRDPRSGKSSLEDMEIFITTGKDGRLSTVSAGIEEIRTSTGGDTGLSSSAIDHEDDSDVEEDLIDYDKIRAHAEGLLRWAKNSNSEEERSREGDHEYLCPLQQEGLQAQAMSHPPDHYHNSQIEKLKIDNSTMKAELEGWKDKHERKVELLAKLVKRSGDLADENLKLKSELESNKASAKASSLEPSPVPNANTEGKSSGSTDTSEPLQAQEYKKLHVSFADQVPAADNGSSEQSAINITTLTGLERNKALSVIIELEEENDALNRAMEDAMADVDNMNKKMASFAQVHEASVRGYEEKLSALKEELDQAHLSKEKLEVKVNAMREEFEVLQEALDKADQAEEYYEQELMGLIEAKEQECRRLMEDIEKAKRNQKEAYQTCEILQREIDYLRLKLKESPNGREQDEDTASLSLSSNDEVSSSKENATASEFESNAGDDGNEYGYLSGGFERELLHQRDLVRGNIQKKVSW